MPLGSIGISTGGFTRLRIFNISETSFRTDFILSKINKALGGDLVPVDQIDFNKLQAELQEDLYTQMDNGFYFEELVANDGLKDFER